MKKIHQRVKMLWVATGLPLIILAGTVLFIHGHAHRIDPAAKKAATPRPSQVTTSDKSLTPLGKTIGDFIKLKAPDSGVYLEDLSADKDTYALDIRPPHDQYNAKSLMKLPLVMNMYKAIENGALHPNDPETIQQSDIDQDYGNLWRQGIGYQLTLQKAADLALQESDNTAIKLITRVTFPVLPQNQRVYNVLHTNMHVTEDRDTFISPKSYSGFLRCLYTSCYNTKQDTQLILNDLEHSSFKAPSRMLPRNAVVAHKIGNVDQNGFNDCGIVYSSKRPFSFCIMLNEGEPDASVDVGQIVKWSYDFFNR